MICRKAGSPLYPLPQRESAKLLEYRKGDIKHLAFSQIPDLLADNTTLFFNDAKVIPARFIFEKETGASIEGLSVTASAPIGLAFYRSKFSGKIDLEMCYWKSQAVARRPRFEKRNGRSYVVCQGWWTARLAALNSHGRRQLIPLEKFYRQPALFRCHPILKGMQKLQMPNATRQFILMLKERWRHLLLVCTLRTTSLKK